MRHIHILLPVNSCPRQAAFLFCEIKTADESIANVIVDGTAKKLKSCVLHCGHACYVSVSFCLFVVLKRPDFCWSNLARLCSCMALPLPSIALAEDCLV